MFTFTLTVKLVANSHINGDDKSSNQNTDTVSLSTVTENVTETALHKYMYWVC